MRNERGFSTPATIVLALLLALLVAPLLMTWVVVEVHTKDADGVDLTVPVPLALARVALAFAPHFAPHDELAQPVPADLSRHRESVLAALRELESCPDTELVSVSAPDATVHVVKRGDRLVIDVQAPDATVRCSLPLKAARQVLERWNWQRFEPSMALDFLAAAGHGELVAVNATDAEVKVRLW